VGTIGSGKAENGFDRRKRYGYTFAGVEFNDEDCESETYLDETKRESAWSFFLYRA